MFIGIIPLGYDLSFTSFYRLSEYDALKAFLSCFSPDDDLLLLRSSQAVCGACSDVQPYKVLRKNEVKKVRKSMLQNEQIFKQNTIFPEN